MFVHGGARPLVSEVLIKRAADTVCKYGAAVPALPPAGSSQNSKRWEEIISHPARENMFTGQTPQAFNFAKLYAGHIKADACGAHFTYDSGLYAESCSPVFICGGERINLKIIFKEDLAGILS